MWFNDELRDKAAAGTMSWEEFGILTKPKPAPKNVGEGLETQGSKAEGGAGVSTEAAKEGQPVDKYLKLSLKDTKTKLYFKTKDLDKMKKQEHTPTVAIKADQKIVDELTAAKEKMTPPEARLIQHDNGLKQLAWEKEASGAILKTATEHKRPQWIEKA